MFSDSSPAQPFMWNFNPSLICYDDEATIITSRLIIVLTQLFLSTHPVSYEINYFKYFIRIIANELISSTYQKQRSLTWTEKIFIRLLSLN